MHTPNQPVELAIQWYAVQHIKMKAILDHFVRKLLTRRP